MEYNNIFIIGLNMCVWMWAGGMLGGGGVFVFALLLPNLAGVQCRPTLSEKPTSGRRANSAREWWTTVENYTVGYTVGYTYIIT